MGFLSNVALVFSKNGYEDFIKKLHETFSDNSSNRIKLFLEECTTKVCDSLNGSKAFYWGCVKWQHFYSNHTEDIDDDYFESYVINKTLARLHNKHYLLIDVGGMGDNSYQVGDYTNNPFGIGLKVSISGFEETVEYENLQIDELLTVRNINLIHDYTIKNITPENIYYNLKDGKDIKYNLIKLILLYITFVVKYSHHGEDYCDKCINKCIEIISMKENFYKSDKEYYSVSSINGLVVDRGIHNLITDTANVFTTLCLLDGIVTQLIYKTNNDSLKLTYSKISGCLRWMSPNKNC